MRVILRRMESLGGLEVATDEALEVDRVTLGRGTDQDVQLPDMRVTLAHAEIRPQAGGGWRIECQGDTSVWVNGSRVRDGALGIGDEIDCGRFRVTIVAAEPDADLVLQVNERVSAREEKGRRLEQYQLDLGHSGLNKRRLAWGLALLALVSLLAAPAALRFGPGGGAGASLDALWQPGPPSGAHKSFLRDCTICHRSAFDTVPNDACLACHTRQRQHSDRADMLQLGAFGDARCGNCHSEHSGHALIAQNPALCTNCHAEPARNFAAAKLPPIHGFESDHPGFTVNLPEWGPGTLRRIQAAQEPGPVEETLHLKFSHAAHLAPGGVNSPEGKRVLACDDCHRPTGRLFAPIRMQDQCADCHQLDFDPAEPARRLPHGAARDVAATVRDHFARKALTGGVDEPTAPAAVRLQRRPGEMPTDEQREVAMDWAEARAQETLEDLFSRRACALCHIVEHVDDPAMPWVIAPVALTTTYLSGARFNHVAHRTASCERCHAAATSKSSSDVLIPTIANCRECHGDPGGHKPVDSTCVSCHGFHIARRAVFGGALPEAAKQP